MQYMRMGWDSVNESDDSSSRMLLVKMWSGDVASGEVCGERMQRCDFSSGTDGALVEAWRRGVERG